MDLNNVVSVKLLDSIPNQPQVQCTLHDQLVALESLARKFGLYDAADFLRYEINAPVRKRLAAMGWAGEITDPA